MTTRISPEHMAEIRAMTRGVMPSQLLAHIDALEEEIAGLRDAGRDVLDMLPYHGLLDLPELRAALEGKAADFEGPQA